MFLVTSSDTSITEAIANTCMGIGTVFLMLIFISLIIGLFGFIPKLEAKLAVKKSSASTSPAPKAAAPAPKASENLMNDAELVAVITAAIYAASGSAGTSSKDKLVVRSIRRAR